MKGFELLLINNCPVLENIYIHLKEANNFDHIIDISTCRQFNSFKLDCTKFDFPNVDWIFDNSNFKNLQ